MVDKLYMYDLIEGFVNRLQVLSIFDLMFKNNIYSLKLNS